MHRKIITLFRESRYIRIMLFRDFLYIIFMDLLAGPDKNHVISRIKIYHRDSIYRDATVNIKLR